MSCSRDGNQVGESQCDLVSGEGRPPRSLERQEVYDFHFNWRSVLPVGLGLGLELQV